MNPINLTPFCSTEELRAYLRKPWSANGCTYATNGHIAVRVPLRKEFPSVDGAPHLDRILKTLDFGLCEPFEAMNLPADIATTKCVECEGRGTDHECPDCNCTCTICDGAGRIEPKQSICIGRAVFDVKYIRMIQALPGLKLPVLPDPNGSPMPFIFDGGDGCLMSMRGVSENHHGRMPDDPLPKESAS